MSAEQDGIEQPLFVAVERLAESVGGIDPHPSDAAAVLVNVGDLRQVLRALTGGES